MHNAEIVMTVILLDMDDFIKRYPRFSTFINGAGKILFDGVMQKDVFVNASVLSSHGYPAVLGVAEKCEEIINNSKNLSKDAFVNQFIGSVVCALMEANGYKKTGKKKSVPHALFTTGECYKKITYQE